MLEFLVGKCLVQYDCNIANGYELKLKFAIFLGHSTNKNIYTSIFPNICQFTNEMEGYIEELTRTSQCLNT